MPTVTLKSIPDALYRRLKRQAAQHRRSLNSEILYCLEQATRTAAVDPATWLREADALRARLALEPLTRSRLRRAKSSGRP